MKKLLIPCLCTSALVAPLISTVSCSCGKENKLEKKLNDWAEKHQSDFIKKLSYRYHNYKEGCTDLYCESEAEAVVMWAYNPGYRTWNTHLHNGLPMTGEEEAIMEIPDESDPYNMDLHHSVKANVRLSDYTWLDSALSHTTATEKITVWHGYEDNEAELKKFIEDELGMTAEGDDLHNTDPKIVKEKYNPKDLVGKSYTNLGYCATSFSKSMTESWIYTCDPNIKTAPWLELEIDPDVYCAYISYTRRKYFDGVFLGYPHEYQLLVNRGIHITIRDAWWLPRDENNILYLKCGVTKGSQPVPTK